MHPPYHLELTDFLENRKLWIWCSKYTKEWQSFWITEENILYSLHFCGKMKGIFLLWLVNNASTFQSRAQSKPWGFTFVFSSPAHSFTHQMPSGPVCRTDSWFMRWGELWGHMGLGWTPGCASRHGWPRKGSTSPRSRFFPYKMQKLIPTSQVSVRVNQSIESVRAVLNCS